MNRYYRMLMLLVLAVSFTACRNIDITNLQDTDLGDGDSVSDIQTVVSVRIAPDSATRVVGETLQVRVQCLNRFGGQVEPCDVVWSSDSEAITVSGGLITFVIVGPGGVCATLEVNGIRIKGCGYFTTKAAPVVPPNDTTTTTDVYDIKLLPEGATGAVGTTLQTTAVCRKNGVVTNECNPRWSSSDGMRITVGQTTGLLSYLYKGQAVICVQWGPDKEGLTPQDCKTFIAY